MGQTIKSNPNEVVAQLRIQLPAVIVKKTDWFVASCPILDVISQGDTIEKAKSNLAEALSLFFISCYERGTLETVLKSCGFRPVHESSAISLNNNTDYVDVPLPFIIDMSDPNRCHA